MTQDRGIQDSATVAEEDGGIRLDRWFKRHRPGTPHALIARWARSGELTIDGRKADVSDRIQAGQRIAMPVPPAAPSGPKPRKEKPLSPAEVALAEAMVIHRDKSALVLDKPPGLATQGGTKTDAHVDGLLGALQGEAPVRPKLVHRLDKDTSGALLVARTPRAAAWFAKAFSNRSARKTYWAIVVGVPDIAQGEIDLPLAKQPGSGGEKMHVDEKGLGSKTRYRVIERAGNSAAWVELQPLTGRTHQLRVHMAAIGHPIVGDGKYGGKGAFLTGTISRKLHLHSRRLRIDHPDGGSIDVSADVPEHFAASLDALGFDLLLGEAGIDDAPKGPPPKAAAKAAAKAHSKQIRKARRGERRGRTATSKPTDQVGKPKTKAKSKPSSPSGRGGTPSPRKSPSKRPR
ncbi:MULTISPECIES: RluA family pseudouridine synthase [unclassified Sphingopyxis]|uniref:RluA family pseudouridine synthase n=1 Tax=unclassified Sphingopyxis TaxID=2614943 RepID=UPI00073071E8|nr:MULTISPECIES: RluA family pseudouridine synthase [unclassified Sphingopyxis]KTE19182.1 RNA pseudouridine synthase [Sphingopyxis sp. H057]KTE48244.1 RNA pseudouridine synthase [Sphingopyxis sp. H073]KTE48577.1 RNA pseudouridine synthase [Sphingopyxis sp. H071]KTE52442.1 RNA pseudouridine synthase [Sphingopyxis sp. H107]KTE59395.1 RNA pseudouridine synthase [Sphingopyxis sp. H100]